MCARARDGGERERTLSGGWTVRRLCRSLGENKRGRDKAVAAALAAGSPGGEKQQRGEVVE